MKAQVTVYLPSAMYSLALLKNTLELSLAFLKGMGPNCSAIIVVPSSEVTTQYMKSRVAWMSSSEALALTAQQFSVPQQRPASSSPSTPQ